MSFEVDTHELSVALVGLSDCISSLASVAYRLAESEVDLRSAMTDNPQVMNRLKGVEDLTQNLSHRTRAMADALDTVIRLYDRAEEDVISELGYVSSSRGAATQGRPQFVSREATKPLQKVADTSSTGPQFYQGTRDGPGRLAGEIFTAVVRPL